ncbi:MAG: tetratricopeptide repeat protein, partial [Pegethrix bostrychoides GSE-TBD4-15B]|nr:tetratricopeptide repeat protein [Pegethrix bostrychoides GSE-TBD4-15B]
MTETLFLGRTEEQNQFRRMLASYQPSGWRKHLPTFSRPFVKAQDEQTSVMLLYGEGGMGKSRLIRRLRAIADEPALARQVQRLFLDWEEQKGLHPDLKVGHDFIQPQTVLEVLHKGLVNANWGGYFEEYRRQVELLKAAEAKLEKQIQAQPENPLVKQVSKFGAQGIGWIIRQHTAGVELVPADAIELGLNLGAEGLSQARQFVQRALTPKEYEVYAQPNQKLAEALGGGIAALARQKPLLILLDTYETVDRPECDYTLREVMGRSGNTIWVIAGRANLADSELRGKAYFRGYRQKFTEDRLYTKKLAEFSADQIQEYFAGAVPEQPLTPEQVEQLTEFSFGIPFVIAEAAAMWREGKPIAEIVMPPTSQQSGTARERVIKQTCERFLMHCIEAKDSEGDLRAVYALAILRRPDAELLQQMLDEPNLDQALQGLRQRYSFIWAEQLSLDSKFTRFLREYLLNPLRRNDPRVQQVNERALIWLRLKLEERTQDIADRGDWYGEEAISETLLHIVNHAFWQSPEAGWRELVPLFLEGWQYSRSWTRNLLEMAELFQPCFDREGQQRFGWMKNALAESPDLEEVKALLVELKKLAQRKWMDGAGAEARWLILRLQEGKLLSRQENYQQALQIYLEIERQLPEQALRLRKSLAAAFYNLSSKFIWADGALDAGYSTEGELAIQSAVRLNDTRSIHYYSLGAVLSKTDRKEEAIAAYHKAIELDPKFATPHNGLGNLYKAQGKQEEAIAAYHKVIELDPKSATPHNALGNLYSDQGKQEEAIAAYHKAIELDPKSATPHNNLGILYKAQGKQEEAIAAYHKAIELDPKFATPHNNLGNLYSDQGKQEEAIAAYHKAIELDPKSAAPHNALGNLYSDQGKQEEAIAAYHKAIELDPKYATPHNN